MDITVLEPLLYCPVQDHTGPDGIGRRVTPESLGTPEIGE